MQEQREFLSQLNKQTKKQFFRKQEYFNMYEDKNVFYSVILNKIISLLQLFCEGHYLYL